MALISQACVFYQSIYHVCLMQFAELGGPEII